MSKIDINNIDLKIKKAEPFTLYDESGIVISWSADIGFGEYTFICRSGLWYAPSEGMDHEEDKAFGRKLLELWMDQIIIVE